MDKSVKPFIKSAKNIVEWEETGEVRILNNTRPIRKNTQKELYRYGHDHTGTWEKIEKVQIGHLPQMDTSRKSDVMWR